MNRNCSTHQELNSEIMYGLQNEYVRMWHSMYYVCLCEMNACVLEMVYLWIYEWLSTEHVYTLYTKRESPIFIDFMSSSSSSIEYYSRLIDRNMISVRQQQKFKWIHFSVFLSLRTFRITLRRILSNRRTATHFSYWIKHSF